MTDLDLNQIEEKSVIRYIWLLLEIYEFGRKHRDKHSLYYLIDSIWCEVVSDMIWHRTKSPD